MRCLIHLLFGSLAAATARAASGAVWATPHESYSSSVGVLGCKVDTNRIAYWPASVDCNNICVRLSYEGRSVHLLRIDQSEGAHDVSYDAWNYLVTGYSAREKPTTGGAIAMEYEDADPSACASLIHTDGNKLPLSAANSMNYLASCLSQDSWVGKNYVLYNILDPVCSWGNDEICTLDWPTANQVVANGSQTSAGAATINPPLNLSEKSGSRTWRTNMVRVAAMSSFGTAVVSVLDTLDTPLRMNTRSYDDWPNSSSLSRCSADQSPARFVP
ncbi:uncharacterized protein B0T15DRAFT_215747 [Chaetomium strumarium]|uniref:Cerato-platanin n=1 Tax=Chaetomium strumarium TaxID=1170767 RepID=A0AAJ0GTQ3_9PEZI|nr:hypothetical protein B0T15DRAFT_215747 [Chaetomium strumarium]